MVNTVIVPVKQRKCEQEPATTAIIVLNCSVGIWRSFTSLFPSPGNFPSKYIEVSWVEVTGVSLRARTLLLIDKI